MVFTLEHSCLISHSGYGYSKRVCEDVTDWFLSKYLPKHKLRLNIVHRGLKRQRAYGYCDVAVQKRNPRDFLIELDTYMTKQLYCRTLIHELVHVKQWVTGSLHLKYGKMYYCNELTENYDYLNQPHEIEARRQENLLYWEYKSKTQNYFSNRLIQNDRNIYFSQCI